jgi:hypothetical protein
MQFITIKSNLFRVFVALDDYNIPFFFRLCALLSPEDFILFRFSIFLRLEDLMKVIPGTRRAYLIRYIWFYLYQWWSQCFATDTFW